jgi:hypothetical protein
MKCGGVEIKFNLFLTLEFHDNEYLYAPSDLPPRKEHSSFSIYAIEEYTPLFNLCQFISHFNAIARSVTANMEHDWVTLKPIEAAPYIAA